jgi:hypothetical protein
MGPKTQTLRGQKQYFRVFSLFADVLYMWCHELMTFLGPVCIFACLSSSLLCVYTVDVVKGNYRLYFSMSHIVSVVKVSDYAETTEQRHRGNLTGDKARVKDSRNVREMFHFLFFMEPLNIFSVVLTFGNNSLTATLNISSSTCFFHHKHLTLNTWTWRGKTH